MYLPANLRVRFPETLLAAPKVQYYFHGNMKTLLAIFTVLIFTLVAQKLTLGTTISASPPIKAAAPILLLVVIAFSTTTYRKKKK